MTPEEARERAKRGLLDGMRAMAVMSDEKPCACCGAFGVAGYTQWVYEDVRPDARRSVAIFCEPCFFIPKDTVRAKKLYRAKMAK